MGKRNKAVKFTENKIENLKKAVDEGYIPAMYDYALIIDNVAEKTLT